MSTATSHSHVSWLRIGAPELKAALIAWSLYLTAMCSYCILHQIAVTASTPNYVGTVVTALREWGAWLLATPLAFQVLRRYRAEQQSLAETVRACSALSIAAASVPIAIDVLTHTRGVEASIALYLPRNVAAFSVVYLIWHAFLRAPRQAPAAVQPPEAPVATGEKPRQYPDTLLVSKGADECLIQVDRVESLSAAGNYVEIVARDQRYLLRATMKQIEDLLAPSAFVRIHRSHIVKLGEIERIKTQPSGNGTVHLRSGRTLSMSKKYKSELQRFRPTLH